MRTRLSLLAAVTIVVGAAGLGLTHAQSITTFTVTNAGAQDYVLNGANDPAITVARGRTYTFNVNTVGHPFFIAAAGPNNAGAPHFTDGVVGNDVMQGSLVFTVPATAPDTLFYQCAIHIQMGGTINVVNAPPPAPAL